MLPPAPGLAEYYNGERCYHMDFLRNPDHCRLAPARPGKPAVDPLPGEYLVRAVSLDTPAYCPYCRWIFFECVTTYTRVLADRPVDDRRVTIEMTLKRYRCTRCDKTFSQPLHGVADHTKLTDRLVSHV